MDENTPKKHIITKDLVLVTILSLKYAADIYILLFSCFLLEEKES